MSDASPICACDKRKKRLQAQLSGDKVLGVLLMKGGGGDVTRRRNYPPSPQFPHRQRCIMALTTIGRLPFSLFLMILWIMLSPVCDRTTLTTNMDHFRPFDVPNDASRAAVISENKHTSIMGEDAIHQLEELENLYRSTLLLRRELVLYNTTAFLRFFPITQRWRLPK
jgi:hypothetical protein